VNWYGGIILDNDEKGGHVPKEKMAGTQLLVPPALLKRAQALAEVRGCSVAEVWRTAIEGSGLRQLERAYADQLSTRERQNDRSEMDAQERTEVPA